VQGAALGVQRQSGYRQRQGCKNEARHRTSFAVSALQ
jgi:hypothetical protein